MVVRKLLQTLVAVHGSMMSPGTWKHDKTANAILPVGQVTPGPIVNLSVFVGYQAGGVVGSVVAALAVFAPAFALVLAAAPLVRRLRAWAGVRLFLQGVNAAVVGAIVAATLPLARGAVVSPFTAAIGVASLVALWRFKVDSVWLVLAAGAAGWLGSVARSPMRWSSAIS